MPIKAILFDLEGTIINTEVLWDECATEFLARHGAVYDRAATKHLLMGRSITEGAVIMRDLYGFTGDPETLGHERRTIFARLLDREVEFEPGFLDFYALVKPAYRLAIATSMERPFLAHTEHHLHLSKYFGDHIYSIADIGFISKPNPDIFLYAAKNLGAQPADCLVIEDAPHGVTAAKAAGMHCAALTFTTSPARLRAAGADQIVDRYEQITVPE